MNRISSKIPIPKRKMSTSKYNNLPLERMNVGDSVKATDITDKSSCQYVGYYNTITRAIHRVVANRDIKGSFRVGVYNSKDKKELRVWRTK